MDQTHEAKSSTKMYMEELLTLFDDPKCGIPSHSKAGFKIALHAGHNAINGGTQNTESLRVAVGATICAMAADKLEQREQMKELVSAVVAEVLPQLVENDRVNKCPLRALPKDENGLVVLPKELANGISLNTRFFNLTAKGRVAVTLLGAAILAAVIIGLNAWVNSKMNEAAERGSERAVERIIEEIPDVSMKHIRGIGEVKI